MKKFIVKYGHCLAALAMAVAVISPRLVCPYIYHQPVMPESVKKLRNF